jgi:hypothetical protein
MLWIVENPCPLSFGGAEGDEESRHLLVLFLPKTGILRFAALRYTQYDGIRAFSNPSEHPPQRIIHTLT